MLIFDHFVNCSPASILNRIWSHLIYVIIFQVLFTFRYSYSAYVKSLTNEDFEKTIQNTDVVFVNFYADWCRFSQLLSPVFDEAASQFQNNTNVIFGSIDSDNQAEVAQKYQISKYPTLKLFRSGKLAKREYRGQRTADNLADFVRSQMTESINISTDATSLAEKIDKNRRSMIAYFKNDQTTEYFAYRGLASNLREDCDFHVLFGIPDDQNAQLVFKTFNGEVEQSETYKGIINNSTEFVDWVTNNCIPLVREITFENAEELTEEGLPFMILFKQQDDQQSLTEFKEVVHSLQDHKNAINFLYADGIKFAHPLHHLGKTTSDLPIIAIDSFRHMYLFPDFKDLKTPGKLRQYIDDMHSGKLHREFHHGADPTDAPSTEATPPPIDGNYLPTDATPDGQAHDHKADQEVFGVTNKPQTSPPLSVFQKLKPSKARYTLKEEL